MIEEALLCMRHRKWRDKGGGGQEWRAFWRGNFKPYFLFSVRMLQGERPYWWIHESFKWRNVTLKQYQLTCETGPGKWSLVHYINYFTMLCKIIKNISDGSLKLQMWKTGFEYDNKSILTGSPFQLHKLLSICALIWGIRCHESTFDERETRVPRENPQSLVEIDWNSVHIQWLYRWEASWMTF